MSLPYHIDKEYEYYLPSDFDKNVSRGSFVIVPFGGGNKKMTAIVVSTRKDDDISSFKPVLSLIPNISLSSEQIGICYFMKDQLFCSVICDGALPRKTFSMGHAQDKRYYIEARKIRG